MSSILEDMERLEPFPRVAVKVLELSLNEAGPREIASVVEKDPGLTARVLRLANSALHGGRVSFDSIFDASSRLGTRSIASLAMSVGAVGYFMGYGSATPRSSVGLWREALYVACFARRLTRPQRREQCEAAYTVGLLQNVGHLVLDRYLEEEQDAIFARVESGEPALVAERSVLGMDHALCGARLARKWEFPDLLVSGIRFHHQPQMAPLHLRERCRLFGVSEALAMRALAGGRDSLLQAPAGGFGEASGSVSRARTELMQSVREEVETLSASFS